MENKRFADFYFKDDGLVILLIPASQDAKNWVKNSPELASCKNPTMPKIERDYFRYIYDDIRMKGLTIKGFK